MDALVFPDLQAATAETEAKPAAMMVAATPAVCSQIGTPSM
jgi:hypothetical protein